MGQKILQVSSFADGLSEAIAIINSRTTGLECRHILIVPDKYTLDAETRLFKNSAGAFDVEVLTFARLFYRICEGGDYLSREGAIMMIRGICEGLELDCYKKSARFLGFAEKVYETINLLLDSGVEIETARAVRAATGIKLEDIKKIYGQYKALTKNKFIDRSGRLELLTAAIEGNKLIENAHFYIANFMEFTAGEKRVIEKLSYSAMSLTMLSADLVPPPPRAKAVEAYDCISGVPALKAAARRIRSAVIGGMRYGDICIVMSSPSFVEAERIFSEYQIPFYTDCALALSEHSLSVYLLGIIELIEKQYRRRDMIAASKNIHFGIPKSDSDDFENFLNEYNVDYLAFREEFDAAKYLPKQRNGEIDAPDCDAVPNMAGAKNKQERLAIAEGVRKAIMRRMLHLERMYKKIKSAADFAAFVRQALRYSQDQDNELEFFKSDTGDAGIHSADAEEKIEEILDLMEKILSDTHHRQSFLRDIFAEGLKSGKIMAIPNLSDSVVIAVPSTFRGQEFKYVLVLGMNEGEIPAPRPQRGLLAGEGDVIEGCISPQQNENITELDHILYSASEQIFVCYDSTSEGGMACYLKAFLDAYGKKVTINSQEAENAQLLLFDDLNVLTENQDAEGKTVQNSAFARVQDAKDLLLEYACSEASATELLLLGICTYQRLGQIASYNSALYAALKNSGVDRYLIRQNSPSKIRDSSLFFCGGSISVSRLQEYFSCPYAHFVRYGLRAKIKKSSELMSVDIGTLLHSVVENFVKKKSSTDDPRSLSKKILGEILDAQPSVSAKIKPEMLVRLEDEAAELCCILQNHFQKGSFVSLGQEISLKESTLVQPFKITAKGQDLILSGSVDYADAYNKSVRIVDYKTGKAELSFADIYYGRKIQLPLYMQAFIASGYRPAGFFLFPFSKKWTDDEKSHRFRGLFDRDYEMLIAMDCTLEGGGSSSVIQAKTAINKEGDIVLYGRHDYALLESQIREICRYSEAVARIALEEIAEGYIAARPYKSGKKCACDYCDYIGICDQRYQNPRQLARVDLENLLVPMQAIKG